MMTNGEIEPRLLGIFRLFVGLMVVLFVLAYAVAYAMIEFRPGQLQITGVTIFVALFVYLSVPRLHKMLGRYYLPLALAVAAITPIVTQRLVLHQLLEEGLLSAMLTEEQLADPITEIPLSSDDSWIIFLFVPLILIAWQYDFRSVLFFSIVTAFVDVALTLHLINDEAIRLIILNAIITRTLAFILIGFIVVRLVERQRQQQAELSKANQQLTNYTTVLENFTLNLEQLATSRERNRLARELHDTLAHTLSAMSVQLEAADTLWDTRPDDARTLLRDSLATTRSGLTETRRALQALRASPIDDLGLALAIRNLAESAAERSGFSLVLDIPQHLDDLSPQVEQTIYRVFQESLENINRHASASQVKITLKRDDHAVTALISDNGCGFDLQTIDTDKLGLRGMRERVEMVGGKLDIKSQQGEGTTLSLKINEVAL